MVFNKKGQKGFFFSERQETKDLLNSLRMSVGVPGRYGCRERHVHYKSRDTGFLWNVSGLILKESFFFLHKVCFIDFTEALLLQTYTDRDRHPDGKVQGLFFFCLSQVLPRSYKTNFWYKLLRRFCGVGGEKICSRTQTTRVSSGGELGALVDGMGGQTSKKHHRHFWHATHVWPCDPSPLSRVNPNSQ